MKVSRDMLAFIALLLFLPLTAMCQGAGDSVPSVGRIVFGDAHLLSAEKSQIRMALDVTVTANENITLEEVRLRQLHLNGLPLFAEPIQAPISLLKNRAVPLPRVTVTAYFANVTTLHPLEEILENQAAHVQGELIIAPRLPFIARLALHSQHPEIFVPLSQDVPVDFGESTLGRQAALVLVKTAEFAMVQAESVNGLLGGSEGSWMNTLRAQGRQSVFEVNCTYSLVDHHNGKEFSIAGHQLGFRLGPASVVTTREAVTPWMFDPEFLARIRSGETKLVSETAKVQIRPMDATALTSPSSNVAVRSFGSSPTDAMFVLEGGRTKVQIERRACAGCYALLTPREGAPGMALAPVPASVAAQESWPKIAVFTRTHSATGSVDCEPLELSATRENGMIHLSQPLDSSSFGSPVLTPEGLLGMVVDESTAVFFPSTIQTLN